MRLAARVFGMLGDLLWPRGCGACGDMLCAEEEVLCAPCAASLGPIGAACRRCAAPLTAPGACGDCARLGPLFRRVSAAYRYEGALVTALHRLKWEGRDDLARPLAHLLVAEFRRCAERCDVIVPVPLHPARLLARGYNQAALLARAVRALAAVGRRSPPVATQVLFRQRAAPTPDRRGPAERFRHAHGAFRVPGRSRARLWGRRVLLVDDVVTTGATAQDATRALLLGGAAQVEVLTLCRAAS